MRMKCRIADGRPWAAGEDIVSLTLDAIMAAVFGAGSNSNAIESTFNAVKIDGKHDEDKDAAVVFPSGQVHEEAQAAHDLAGTAAQRRGTFSPRLSWALLRLTPKINNAVRIKEKFIRRELRNAASRLREKQPVSLILDRMVAREKISAEKERRQPDYLSQTWVDEVCLP